MPTQLTAQELLPTSENLQEATLQAFKGRANEDEVRRFTGAHAQGIASGGGILQINWFIENGTPVGQFNAVTGAIGVVECGGSGKWQRK